MQTTKQPQDSNEPKYSFDEVYKSVVHILINGTKEQQTQAWKLLNEGKGEWIWMKMKVITDAYSFADAEGKEEFTTMAMEHHLKSGNAILLDETFSDSETNIVYKQYKFKSGTIYRIPTATKGMDKYAYEKALNKKFLGDCIEMSSVDGVTLIPLDTEEKVNDYNSGDYFKKHHLPSKPSIKKQQTKK